MLDLHITSVKTTSTVPHHTVRVRKSLCGHNLQFRLELRGVCSTGRTITSLHAI